MWMCRRENYGLFEEIMALLQADNGIYLTRLPRKTGPDTNNRFGTNVPWVEYIPFDQIAWAMRYGNNHSILLLNTLEFRCYIQNLGYIKEKVCQFVGYQAKAGIACPRFPWVVQ
jgi:hypothetical protein